MRSKLNFISQVVVLRLFIACILCIGINFNTYVDSFGAVPSATASQNDDKEESTAVLLDEASQNLENLSTGHSLPPNAKGALETILPSVDLGTIGVLQSKGGLRILHHKGQHTDEYQWNGSAITKVGTHAVGSTIHDKFTNLSNRRDLQQMLGAHNYFLHHNFISDGTPLPDSLHKIVGQSHQNYQSYHDVTHHVVALKSEDSKELSIFKFPILGSLKENTVAQGV